MKLFKRMTALRNEKTEVEAELERIRGEYEKSSLEIHRLESALKLAQDKIETYDSIIQNTIRC
jgi:predicted  nucleic acid-binding Zn-ribbon protein